MQAQRVSVQRAFLLLLVAATSAVFLWMIRAFLVPLLLAATFASLSYPLYERCERRLRGRRAAASALTLLLLLLLVALPLLAFGGLIVAEAVKVASAAEPWMRQAFAERGELFERLQRLPGYELARPYWRDILERTGTVAGALGKLALSQLSSLTAGTLSFLLDLAIMLYAMFFFYTDGPAILRRILYLVPLSHDNELQLLSRFRSMARATVKGTLVIGVAQGAGAGAALALAGVPSALLWSVLMAVASLLPTVGTALIWGPAALYLMLTGSALKGLLVAAWCAVVVGSVDNVLRPILVGKDTEVHELLILLSTLGGMMLFGLSGILLGPVLAVMFLTVWDLYAVAFRQFLPGVGKL